MSDTSHLGRALGVPRLGVQSPSFAGMCLPAGIHHRVQIPHQRDYKLDVLIPQVAELHDSYANV